EPPMSGGAPSEAGVVAIGGVSVDHAFDALRRLEPALHAFYLYDLDALEARARRLASALAPIAPLAAYALKANALPAILDRLILAGIGAEAGSVGELELAAAAGVRAAARVLNGN